MPLTIDPTKTKTNDGNLHKGVPLVLTKEQRDHVVMSKYISMNSMLADWQPEGKWFEQVVADINRSGVDRLQIEDEDGNAVKLTDDHGLIVSLEGTLDKVVGIVPGVPVMDEEAAEEYREATGAPVPMYQKWDFRVTEVLKTCGPQDREALARSEDQKRQDSESSLLETLTKVFKTGAMRAAEEGELAPSVQSVVDKGSKK